MQAAIPMQCLEIMDEVQMRVVNLSNFTAPRVWVEKPTLFLKFAGTKGSVKEQIQLVEKITANHKGGNFEFAKDEKEQKLLWSARKESLWSMLSLRKEGEDVCELTLHCVLSPLRVESYPSTTYPPILQTFYNQANIPFQPQGALM
jgi:D-lactate dehydrogenase (cytochrome)